MRPSRIGNQVWTLASKHGVAAVVFAALFVMVTWPWAKAFQHSLLGSVIADAWEEVEQFWWYKQALLERHVSPLYNPDIFYPEGWNTVTGSHSPTLMFPTVPFTLFLGHFGAYFLLMAAGFVFAGVGMYVLLFRITGVRLAGVLAGISYAFCMSRLLRIGGHFNTATGSAWIPWVFAFLEVSRHRENGHWKTRWLILSGLAFAAAMLSYWYFAYIIAIPLAAFFLNDLWKVRRIELERQAVFRAAVVTFLTAVLVVAPFALLTWQARESVGIRPYAVEATIPFVASPDRFLIPNRYHPLWGRWLATQFPDRGEQTFIFLGLTSSVLALVAIVKRLHPRVSIYLTVTLVAMIMAMGPQLHWDDAPVALSLPGLDDSVGIPMPGALFFRLAPFFDTIRVWARFSLVASFAIGVLAGLALAGLRGRWQSPAISLALVGLVALESFGHPFSVVPSSALERDVDHWLAEQPGQFAIMELPLDLRLNGSLNYSHILHGKQLATGYATAMPRHFLEAVPHFAKFPNQETVDILRQWEVGYLLYTVNDPVLFQQDLSPAFEELTGLTHIATFDGNSEPYISRHLGRKVFVYAVDQARPDS